MSPLELTSSKLWLIHFYREQLIKLEKLGMGKKTEFGVTVTEGLIKVTRDRLNKLSVVYDNSLTSQAHKLRQIQLERLKNGHKND